jgi:hypothetical protein
MTLFAESLRVSHRAEWNRGEPRAASFCVLCVHGASSDWPACAKSSEKICFLSALRSLYIESRPTTATFSRGVSYGEFASRGVRVKWLLLRAADSHIKAPAALIETQMAIKRRITAAQCQKGAVNCTRYSVLPPLCICLSVRIARKRDGGGT